MSDFKTNEYTRLLGGEEFEPKEENPMIGFRGAFRYYDCGVPSFGIGLLQIQRSFTSRSKSPDYYA